MWLLLLLLLLLLSFLKTCQTESEYVLPEWESQIGENLP